MQENVLLLYPHASLIKKIYLIYFLTYISPMYNKKNIQWAVYLELYYEI